MSYNTGNALGSTDVRDLLDNAHNLDDAVNDVDNPTWVDRFGRTRKTLKGYDFEFETDQAARAMAFNVAQTDRTDQFNQFLTNTAYELPPIPFVEGSPLELSRATQLISHEGNLYSVKLPASFPVVLSGVWDVAVASLTVRSDQSLRQALADPTLGPAMVALPTQGFIGDAIQHVVPLAKTSAAVLAAANYAWPRNLSVELTDGEYSGSDIEIGVPVSFVLRPNAHLNFAVTVAGSQAETTSSILLTGDFAAFPAGTTTFLENFSFLAPGDRVMIELTDGGSQAFNEVGVDFGTVSSANGSQLVLTEGTRLAYRNPRISKLAHASRYIGSLPVNSISIPGDYTASLSVGDIIRLENTTGTDGVDAVAFYFELSKVVGVTTSKLTLETRTTHAYGNPWIVKTGSIDGVIITGPGRIKKLTVRDAHNVLIDGALTNRAIRLRLYRYKIVTDMSRGISDASTNNLTFSINGSVTDVSASGSLSSTDNGAFKVLGCPNLVLTNTTGDHTTATAQGNYGVFIDYFYTPYKVWNANLRAQGLRGATPDGGSPRAVWLTGIRNGAVQATGGQIFLQSSVDSQFDAQCSMALLEIADLVRCEVTGSAKLVSWQGCIDSSVRVKTHGTGGANSGRCIWARASSGKNPETGLAYAAGQKNEFNPINFSLDPSDRTLYIQNQDDPIVGPLSSDNAGLAASIEFGSGVNNPRMAPSFLRNSLPPLSGWGGARTKGYLHLDGDYRDAGLNLGGQFLWAAAGGLRVNSARPTSQLLGAPVVTRVAVPATSTSPGVPGAEATNATFLYKYTGDGTTHTWVRTAVTTW